MKIYSLLFMTVVFFFLLGNGCSPTSTTREEIIVENESITIIDSSNVFVYHDTGTGDPTSESKSDSTDPRPSFTFDLTSGKNALWYARAELRKNGGFFSPGIAGATVMIDSAVLAEDLHTAGVYTCSLSTIAPGQTITVRLALSDADTPTITARVPECFSRTPSLTASTAGDTIELTWERVACNSYGLYKRMENDFGSFVEIAVDEYFGPTDTIYTTTRSTILDKNISMSPTPRYFTFWVCPLNRVAAGPYFTNDSYLRLFGKPSNGVTNKPVK